MPESELNLMSLRRKAHPSSFSPSLSDSFPRRSSSDDDETDATIGLENKRFQGQSTRRPPFFDGSNYLYWKTRMELFIQANDYEVWRVITHGPNITMKKEKGSNVPKDEDEWDANEIKMMQLNYKAMHILYCALGPQEYSRMYLCDNAKEMSRKMLNSLPTSWRTKVTVVEECHDLNKLSLDELIGSLLSYEMRLNYEKMLRKLQRSSGS
ncbi:uncharacterized protein LOC120202773 [Hibiscus syriacus]|uniref:uncharacterized protein LOC120202773 n=1 Tax=Hibiscus syriacus TaxID=106335 RepID=UPI00192082BB|nr:uncharacterized protein LOC120202773 [Hibiscus syriacus]